ncbi:MAG: C39 family peptidase [Anaerosomatales bacterium]|nr:C39 family peptidase [Coriobacteriia bacterium]MDI6691955.1 C39 family peptidase [Anaerosomatales bacterium]
MKLTRTLIAATVVAALVAQPALAFADTGDGRTDTKNVISAADAQIEQHYQAWLRRAGGKTASAFQPTAVDAPFRYFYTPSHRQEKNYYCGPATVQIIADYWGECPSQDAIAKWLGTDVNKATDFSLVDDALRYFTKRPYTYVTCRSLSDVYNRICYGMLVRGNPEATDVRIDADVWPNYVYDHLGHIIPLEAFDWRNYTVRVNDPYDERYYRGGGDTYGHKTYQRSVVAAGIMAHPRHAIVY